MYFLAIDISREVGQILKLYLVQRKGHRLDFVSTQNGAIDHLEGNGYDCVLLDAAMPDDVALHVLEKAKDLGYRVLIFTWYDESHPAVQNLIAHGADAVLEKPFSVDEAAVMADWIDLCEDGDGGSDD